MPKLDAAIYTHNLSYNRVNDEEGSTATLSGQVSFEDSDSFSQSNTNILGDTINRDFITNVTYTYTPSAGATPLTLVYNDFQFFKIIHNPDEADTDYSAANLKSQLNDLQFQGSNENAFDLDFTGTEFKVEVAGQSADFILDNTTYHSPAPLPFLGLISSFAFMKKLKAKYKAKL